MPFRIIIPILFALAIAGVASGQGLVAHLPLDSNANDVSGNGHHGVNYGAQPVSDRFGQAGKAMLFDGVDDYIRIPDHPQIRSGEVTLSIWLKFCEPVPPRYQDDDGPIIIGKGAIGESRAYMLQVWWPALIVGRTAYPNDSLGGWDRTTQLANDGRWHHCVYAVDSGTGRGGLWVDGARFSNGVAFEFLDTITADFFVARNVHSNNFFHAALDDIRIYDRCLLDSEVQALYRAGGWPNVILPTLRVEIDPPGPVEICAGDSIQLHAQTSGPLDHIVWRPANGLVPGREGDSIVTVRPDTTTRYRVVVSLGEPCSEVWDSADVTVIVHERPLSSASPLRTICAGDSVMIGGDGIGGLAPYRYWWSATAGIVDRSRSTQVVSPSATTTYYLTVTDANDCGRLDSIRVVVIPPPRLSLPSELHLCRGAIDAIGATATGGTGPYRYRWSPATSLSSDTVAQPLLLADSTRRYFLRATDINGCVATDSIDVVVIDPPVADAGVDVSLCTDSSSTIGTTAVPGYLYRWDPDPSLSDTTIAQPIVRPTATTTYFLSVIDTTTGCRAIDSVVVHVLRYELQSDRARLDFGVRFACDTTTMTRSVVIRNVGARTLTIHSIVIDAPFIGNAIPLPLDLAPGDSMRLDLLLPATVGLWSGSCRVAFHDGNCQDTTVMELVGEIVAPALEVPSIVDVGFADGCRTWYDTAIAVANPGSLPLTIVALNGAPGLTLQPSASLPIVIEAESDGALPIRISRSVHGPFTITARVRLAECDTTIVILLRGDYRAAIFTHADTIDVGEVIACGDTTVSFQFDLTYMGGAGRVGRVITATTDSPFSIDSLVGVGLDSGVTHWGHVYFTPTTDGVFVGTVRLTLDPCGLERSIVLLGRRSTATLVADPAGHDLGVVLARTTSIRDVLFINRGTVPVRVDSLNGLDAPFAVQRITPPPPTVIEPGDTLRVMVACTGLPGAWTDTLRAVVIDPCTSVAPATIAFITPDGANARLSLNRITARAGEHRRIRAVLEADSSMRASTIRLVDVTLRFNASLLLINTGQSTVSVLKDSVGWKRVRVRGDVEPIAGEVVGVDVTALLGSSNRTPIHIDDVKWMDANGEEVTGVVMDILDGEFTLDGICPEGGERLVDGSGEFFLRSIIPTPTPTFGVIEFGLVEDGPIALEIVDLNGRLMQTLHRSSPGPGCYRVLIDTRSLDAGTYLVALRTESSIRETRLVVSRR